MKCVKEKCKYYGHHTFQASYRICILEDITFHKDVNKVCNIDEIINEKNDILEMLKKYKEYLKL